MKSAEPEVAARWRPALLITAVVLLAHLPALWGGFLWADFPALHDNAALRDGAGLATIWTTHGRIPNESHYWPLVYTTFRAEFRLWGLWAPGYRAVNLLLHLANALLVHGLWRRLGLRAALPAALLFAVHPIHVESVAWIIGRKDVLALFFALLAAHCHLAAPTKRRPWVGIAGGAVLMGMAMLSNSIVIGLPLLLAIALWWRGRLDQAAAWRLAPMTAVAVGIGVIDTLLAARAESFSSGHAPLERLLLACRAVWFYAGKFLLPWPLVPIYPAPDPALWARGTVALGAGVVLLGALGVLAARGRRGPLAAALAFLVALAPVLGFIDFVYMEHSLVADRFVYLAGIPFLALVAAGLEALPRPRLVVGAVVVGLGVLCFQHCRVYQDIPSLFGQVLRWNPASHAAHGNMGAWHLRGGDLAAARAHLEQAVALRPDYQEAHHNLGLLRLREGRLRAAVFHLRRAIALGGPGSDSRNELAWILATAPDPALRAPAEALALATEANERTGGRVPAILDTLAAAQAAYGDHAAAAATARRAEQAARDAGQHRLAAAIAERRALFEAGRDYVDKNLAE